jgi:hypothetical protein
MSNTTEERTEASGSSASLPFPIRMVTVFAEAVGSQSDDEDALDPAFQFECWLIAAESSITALSSFAELCQGDLGGGSGPGRDRQESAIHEGYMIWFDAAEKLFTRGIDLEERAYESERFDRFRRLYADASQAFREATDRRDAEERALDTGRLASLAAKLKPHQATYD